MAAHGYGLVAAGGAGVGPALKILRGDAAALFTSWAVQPLRICPSYLHTSMLKDIRR